MQVIVVLLSIRTVKTLPLVLKKRSIERALAMLPTSNEFSRRYRGVLSNALLYVTFRILVPRYITTLLEKKNE